MREHRPRRPGHDRLIRDPQLVERVGEADLQAGSITDLTLALDVRLHGLATDTRHLVEAGGPRDHVSQLRQRNRLGQVAKGAELHGANGVAHVRTARDEDDGQIEVVLADRPQQIEPCHVRHRDVAHEHVEGEDPTMLGGDQRVIDHDHVEALPTEIAREHRRNCRVVVDEEDPAFDAATLYRASPGIY